MINKNDWKKLTSNRETRTAITSKNFEWFFSFYFAHYIKYATAPFQKEMMRKASNPKIKQLAVMAFRESGKSSILTTALPMWSITGSPKKKFVIIIGKTQELANAHLHNIATALESDLVKKDFWPYEYEENTLNQSVITLPKYGAKIIALGRNQSMRGLLHNAHRPDLIIVDDVEDSASALNPDNRELLHRWLSSEVLALGCDDANYVFIGNLVHEDSLMARLKNEMESGIRAGTFLQYPIAVNDIPLWKARFKDMAAVKELEKRIGNPLIWAREYLLKIVSDQEQLVQRDMIKTFHGPVKPLSGERSYMIIGVDPAIATGPRNDYTAMVRVTVVIRDGKKTYYVHGFPVNARFSLIPLIRKILELNRSHDRPKFYVEQTSFQRAIIQAVEKTDEVISIQGVDSRGGKEERLGAITHRISEGKILFEDRGCEELIKQLTNLGLTAHDDLVDGLTIAITSDDKDTTNKPRTVRLGPKRPRSDRGGGWGPGHRLEGGSWSVRY